MTAEVRQRILEAGCRLLRERGPAAVTQAAVAEAAGVRQGHLTYYFRRKQDLLLAIADHGLDQLSRQLARAPGDRDTITDAVTAVVADRHRTQLEVGVLSQLAASPELRQRYAEAVERNIALVRLGAPATATADDLKVLHAALWGLTLQHWLFGDRGDGETAALVRRLFAIYEAGFGRGCP